MQPFPIPRVVPLPFPPIPRKVSLMNRSILRRVAFFLYPASQLVMVVVSAIWIVRLQLPEGYLWAVGLLALASIPVDFQLVREVRKTQEADILRERVRMLEEQERVQVAYREQITADMEDIMALRREVAAEVEEAVRQLREKEEVAAQERLSRAVNLMGSTAYRLCEHRSADAVATMKAKACEDAGVRSQFSLEIPYDVGVPAVELCAVIANLADNGLAAALRSRESEATAVGAGGEDAATAGATEERIEPFVSLRSHVRQGHLVIEARNSIAEADRIAWEESERQSHRRRRTWSDAHGWGLSIISGIAQRHGGTLECEIEGDDVFCATVLMRVGNATAPAAMRANAGAVTASAPSRLADDLEPVGDVL